MIHKPYEKEKLYLHNKTSKQINKQSLNKEVNGKHEISVAKFLKKRVYFCINIPKFLSLINYSICVNTVVLLNKF